VPRRICEIINHDRDGVCGIVVSKMSLTDLADEFVIADAVRVERLV
jgi:hypothetical protein